VVCELGRRAGERDKLGKVELEQVVTGSGVVFGEGRQEREHCILLVGVGHRHLLTYVKLQAAIKREVSFWRRVY
jgi:hypothetical protein